ncbi:Bulb-type lectin domain containing protein [Parasponia andersonii]|uniref:Bulb-type lectin domain containing protein n=1 Tax=Parasponia andersonii TaxID=3476 RepID=A0A2P5BW36_PARAD|nr:Bulb-type lectin domain containing protein [Parasponia andersonii]
MAPFLTIMLLILLLFFRADSLAPLGSSIAPFPSLREGTTLVSKQGTFELVFFSPGSSNNCYLGIWYENIPVRTIVWVANQCK